MHTLSTIPRVWQRIGVFISLTYAINAPFEYLAIVGGGIGSAGGLYALGGMWSPCIAAFITAVLFGKETGPFGWRRGKTRDHLWGILTPLLSSRPRNVTGIPSGVCDDGLQAGLFSETKKFVLHGSQDYL